MKSTNFNSFQRYYLTHPGMERSGVDDLDLIGCRGRVGGSWISIGSLSPSLSDSERSITAGNSWFPAIKPDEI